MSDGPVHLARALLARGQNVRFIARGRSMWPTILDGDRVTLAPRSGPIRVGDVVFLPTDDFGITHRVVARVGVWCCLKGDAAVRPDGWFEVSAFSARVIDISRDGRSVPLDRGLPPTAAAWAQSAVRGMAKLARRG